nr:ABC transporter A family member 7-like isoform X1 [Tanacetum cinerariifolium]
EISCFVTRNQRKRSQAQKLICGASMADSRNGLSSFWTQADALFRKNLTFQEVCGIQYSNLLQATTCSIPRPLEWPPLLQLPDPHFRAVRTDFLSSQDLPSDSCKSTDSCRVTVLTTGENQSLGENGLAGFALGSATSTAISGFLEPALYLQGPVYYVQSRCGANFTNSISVSIAALHVEKEIKCVQGLNVWRNSSSDINKELYSGYRKGNTEKKINEIPVAYDFLNSNINNYNVTVWYNSTYRKDRANLPPRLVRVPRSINLVSNAFLQLVAGPSTQMLFDFVKEMPKPVTKIKLDFSSLLGPLFFTWVILQLFPIVLTALVYEEQQNLRIMMKMHGLGDGPYWMISYAYFLVISLVYMFCFVVFGSVVGLKFFTLNDYSIQLVFYFIYVNLQISMAFLMAAFFSNVKTAAVVAYILVFGTGLLGGFLFQFFLQDTSFPRVWIIVMELYPGFSLYGGLFEFSQYAFMANYTGTHGMRWENLSDNNNGIGQLLIVIAVEWLVLLVIAYYIDLIVTLGRRARKGPLFFLEMFIRKHSLPFRTPSLQRQSSKVHVQPDKPKTDVLQEASTNIRPKHFN